MSVNAVASTSASVIANAASKYVNQTTGSTSTASSAMQEATETAATTAKEAAHGDPIAKRLLARQQQEKQLQDPTPSEEPGKGEQIDQKG